MCIMNYKSTVIMLLYIYILLITLCIYTKKEEYFENYEIIPKYVINLDKSKDRYSSILKQTKYLNIKNWYRFSGIDGSMYKLTDNEKSMFRNADFDYKISRGIAGCALSHFYVWKLMTTNNIKECIVLEDDIIFSNDFNKEINILLEDKSDFDVIYLYNTMNNDPRDQLRNEIIHYNKLKWHGCGAVGYYINIKAAKYLVDIIKSNGFRRGIDWEMYEHLNKIKIGMLKYPILKHSGVKSVIKENNID
jgi:GR25 family glycosyltransferase involved in LPS biosynthesis